MDKTSLQRELSAAFRYDALPVFPLNRIHRKYRNKFIKLINSGEIRLKPISRCPCGAEVLSKVAGKDRFGLPFSTLICSRCGLLVTSPCIDESDISRYYKLIYHPLVVGTEKGVVQDTYSFSPDQGRDICGFVAPLLPPRAKPLNVLEIGCADGYGLAAFAAAAEKGGIRCRLHGTEFESHLKTKAAERGITVLDDDIRGLARTGLRFDLIIMSHVFEHVSDLRGTLEILSTVLEDDGILFIEVPGIMNLDMMARWYNSDFLDYIVHAHLYQFNLESLRNILALGGFKMLRGDEVVRGVFMKGDPAGERMPAGRNCEEILAFLHRTYVGKNRAARSLLRRLYWDARMAWGRIYYPLFHERPDLARFSSRLHPG